MDQKKITKSDLVENVHLETKIEKKTAQKVIDEFLAQLKKSLEEGNVIELRGFGTFEPRLRKGRNEARNPKDGKIVSVPPHYVAAFRAGQELKKNMWELPVEN